MEGFKLVAEDHIKRLFQGCPLLEELYLLLQGYKHESECDQVEALDISIPSLKKLVLPGMGGKFPIAVESKNIEYFCYQVKGKHEVS